MTYISIVPTSILTKPRHYLMRAFEFILGWRRNRKDFCNVKVFRRPGYGVPIPTREVHDAAGRELASAQYDTRVLA